MRSRVLSCIALLCLATGSVLGQTSFTNSNAITLSSTAGGVAALDTSTITSTGLSGKISKVTVTLTNWTENADGGGNIDRQCFLAFTPSGSLTASTYEFLGEFGNFLGLTNVTVTLDDASGNTVPMDTGGNVTGAHTYRPGVANNAYYNVDPPSGLASGNTNFAAPDGTATFATVFNGLTANGTWTLYIYDHQSNDAAASIAGGWTVTITNAVEDGTATTITPSTSETFEGTAVTFTATVTDTSHPGTTVTAGSVTFTDELTGTTLGTQPVSNGQATQSASFTSEGSHAIQASYSDGSNTFGPSSMSAPVFIDHTTTNSSPTFCNAGPITINATSGTGVTEPYPQHIFPSGLTGSLSGLSLTLNSLQNLYLSDLNVLLVGPSGNSKFVALAGAGASGSMIANGTSLGLSDFGSGPVPSSNVGNGPYLPTDLLSSLTFGAGTPAGPYSLPQTEGSATFATTFAGETNPNGMWSVYIFDRTGGGVSTIGGTCLTFTTSAIAATTTSLSVTPPANLTVGQTVTFTATVTSGGSPVTSGTVTFKENGTTLQGAAAVDSSGKITFSTNSLTEGIHNISALYSGVPGTYNVSSATASIEVDKATTVTGTTYCNPGGITNNLSGGATTPYPSRINVSNLAGTVQSVTVSTNNFTQTFPQEFEMLLVGPSATNLDFFEDAGSGAAVSGLNFVFSDAASGRVPSTLSSGTFLPTANAENGVPFPAPVPPASGITFAGPIGTATLASSFATANFNGNGYWSLFTVSAGSSPGTIGSWCVNFTENPPVLAVTKTHTGSFTQGDTGDTYTITVTNNGPGSTGGTLTLADTLPTGMTGARMGQTTGGTGSDWTCTASTATCTRTTPMANGEADVIALEVGVGFTTPVGTNAATNSVSVSGGGAATVTATDPTTIIAGTVNITFSTSTAGLSYSVDGTTYTTSQTIALTYGSTHTIATTSPQNSTGTQNTFTSWSDGGALSHQIKVSNTVTSYTANFSTSYLLTTAASPSADGTVTPTSGSYYPANTVVNLVATPNSGYKFTNWTGSVANANSASTTVTMSGPRTVTANFVVNNQNVTINTSPTGLLVSIDGGAAQAAPVSLTWQVGTQHTIATISPQGSNGTQYTFIAWSDNGATSHTVTASNSVPSYTASFSTAYLLTTSASPVADGTVTPASGTYYASGTVVNLVATPNSGYNFTNWTGNVANANSASTTVTMSGPQTVTANFVINNQNVTINTAPTGLLVIIDGGAAQAAPVSLTWQVGTQHTIATISPQGSNGTQYTFIAWSDNGATSHTVTASNSVPSYTASFNTTYLLTTSASPIAGGTVTPASGSYYPSGTVVNLVATPNTGYNFVNWTGNVANANSASTTVTMSAPQTVTANFVINNQNVTINTSPTGLLVSIDGGAAQATPVALTWQVGTQHTIATTSPQGSSGTHYTFTGWSDGGALSHTVTASNSVPSYTASFNTTYLLTTSASPVAGGTVTPASGSYYPSGTVVNLTATANTGYNFTNWTGSVANANSASTTVTMSAPQTVVANFTINNTNVTINTSPTGLLVSIDGGAAQAAPVSATWQVGTQHTIATTSPQGSAGTRFTFSAWSDGGAPSHIVTASNSVTSYTASFSTAYFLTTSASPAAGGTIAPPSAYFVPGTVVNLTATPTGGYIFAGWTGNVANANSASTTVTMSGPQTVVANFTGPSAVFVAPPDTTTQGNWVGNYGQDGYIIANDATVVPGYATVTFNGAGTYTWVPSSTDPRALLKNPTTTDRIASTYHSATSFTIDVNLMDALTHQVALYLLDLDTFSRNETISILDANTNNVLDTRSFSSFHGGEYAIWNLTGHVLIQVTSNAGLNGVVSGVFFKTITPPAGPTVAITAPTASQSISGNFMFKANATAPTGIASVQFVLDGANYGAPVTGAGSTYSIPIATATLTNGGHTLKATATDNLSQTMTSATVAFTVSNPGIPPASAVFVPPPDTATQGNWVSKYGGDGYVIANDASSLPVYANVSFNGATTYTWSASTIDPRALLKSPSSSDRIASTYYAGNSFTIDVNLVDNQPHQVALYCLDFDDNRAETISILDANSNAVLDTETVSNFQNGQYLVWNMQGHVLIQVTRTGGLNAVVSALFFATVPPNPPPGPVVTVTAPTSSQTVSGSFTLKANATSSGSTIASVQFVLDGTTNIGPLITSGTANVYSYTWPSTTVSNGSHTVTAIATDNLSQKTTSAGVTFTVSNAAQTNSATFVTTDTTTHGNWKGAYGSDGEIIANDSNAPPSYAVVNFTGASQFTWATTTDVRALLMATSSTNRIASTFYNSPSFSIDVNFTDANTHQIALYLLDWDSSGRAETIIILDASNNNVLDSKPASGFLNGEYLVWNVKGHVIIQVTDTAGPNAVVSGVFFAPGS